MKQLCISLFVTFIVGCSIHAQGTFQNLDFELANIPPGTPAGTFVSTNAGLPGWIANRDFVYDGVSGGGPAVAIDDANTIPPLEGDYSVVLFGGPGGPTIISQTGLVPANSLSVLMDVSCLPSALFTVTLGGQQIAMSPVQTFANYTVYGGNISAEAGQVAALTITQFDVPPPQVPPSELELDNIIFSPNAIPEPATAAMVVCGGAMLYVARQLRKRAAVDP